MSIDRSLRSKSSLERHRNVLTRAERVQRLVSQERFGADTSPLGLPKVAHHKAKAGKKKAAAKAEGEAAAAAPGAPGVPEAAANAEKAEKKPEKKAEKK